jgi:hypothetical protein
MDGQGLKGTTVANKTTSRRGNDNTIKDLEEIGKGAGYAIVPGELKGGTTLDSNFMDADWGKDRTTSLRGNDDAIQKFSLADLGINANAANDFNTQVAGYIPKNLGVGFYGSDSIARGLHKKATTEGVGATEFGKYIEGAELGAHPEYANTLLNELMLSDKVESLGDDYVRGLDIKGLGDSYDDQRKAVGTLLKDVKTKTEALKGTDKSWMLGPGDKRPAVREFTSDYSQNKDRLNDLGITTLEEYKDFINKSIGMAQGGRVGYNTGGRVGILAAF